MSAVAPITAHVGPRWPALIPPLLIAIPVALKLAGVPIANPWIIFALLFGLMLTGMPISISLGLTVLTYLFTMTTVPIESVALKLFTGIEKFEIMAIPFFILAGNFLTHGGVARRMIKLRVVDGRPLARRPGPGGRHGLRAVRRRVGQLAGDRGGDRLDHPAGDGRSRASRRASAPASSRRPGALGILIPPSIVMVMYAVATNTSVGALFIAGIVPGLVLATHARRHHLVARAQEQLPAAAEGHLAPSAGARSARASGACCS